MGRASSRSGTVRGGLEGSLSSAAVKRTSSVRARSGTKGLVVHGAGVAASTASQARGKEVARRASKVLIVASPSIESVARVKRAGTGTGSASHGALPHVVLRRVIHGRRISRIGHDSSAGTAGSTAKAAYVLGKVMVAADFVAALPVTSTERNNTTTATTTTTHASTMAHVAVTAVVRGRHHLGRAIAAAAATTTTTAATITEVVTAWARAGSRERASEAGGSALEVGKAARGACPVARTRSVLAGREGCKNILSTIENSAGGRGDLNGLFVEGSSVHAETFSSLGEY